MPEIIIRQVVARGIGNARREDKVLDMLFRNTPTSIVESLKDAFREVTVDITLNYPREDIQLPCVAILLRGEDETESVLGDLLGEGYGPGTINGLAAPGSSGRGSADSRIRPEFFYTPDENSVVQEHYSTDPTGTIIGEPRKMFVDDGQTLHRREGVGDEASYLIHILASRPEMVIFLYVLIKYILRRDRMILERNGVLNMTLSGTDFAPQPTYLPIYTYSRALSCRFLYWFDWFRVEGETGSLSLEEARAKGLDIEYESLVHGNPESVVEVDVLSQLPIIQSTTPSSILNGVQAELIIEGLNIQNVASIRFPQLEYDVDAGTGIEILSVQYIDGNKLRATVLPHSTGTTNVVVINPDFLSTTLDNGLTVT